MMYSITYVQLLQQSNTSNLNLFSLERRNRSQRAQKRPRQKTRLRYSQRWRHKPNQRSSPRRSRLPSLSRNPSSRKRMSEQRLTQRRGQKSGHRRRMGTYLRLRRRRAITSPRPTALALHSRTLRSRRRVVLWHEAWRNSRKDREKWIRSCWTTTTNPPCDVLARDLRKGNILCFLQPQLVLRYELWENKYQTLLWLFLYIHVEKKTNTKYSFIFIWGRELRGVDYRIHSIPSSFSIKRY